MFELTPLYLNNHYSAETGDYSGSLAAVKACIRYQRAWKILTLSIMQGGYAYRKDYAINAL